MANLKISSPWQEFNNKVKTLFDGDKDIEVGDIYKLKEGDAANYAFDILVRKHEKFVALDRVLPGAVEFGNITVAICLQDLENHLDNIHPAKLFAAIFEGNPHIKDVKEINDVAGFTHAYVQFKPEVLQFFNDDLSDYNRNWSGLAQDIAEEVFIDLPGTHFCTAPVDER